MQALYGSGRYAEATEQAPMCHVRRLLGVPILTTTMAEDDALAAMRARAYDLADTGLHEDWDAIAAQMMDEGSLPVLVRRVGQDAFFKIMLGNRINAALEQR